MKVVIDVPDILYKKIQRGIVWGEVCECVKKGTVLSEEYGLTTIENIITVIKKYIEIKKLVDD